MIVFLLIFFLFCWNRKVVRTVWDPKLCQDKKKCSRSSELTIFPLSYWRRYRGSWRRIDWISSSIHLQWDGTNCNESYTKNYFIIWTWNQSICGLKNVWGCFLKELKFCESMGHQDQAGISGLDLKEKSNFNHNVRIMSFGQVIECWNCCWLSNDFCCLFFNCSCEIHFGALSRFRKGGVISF